MHSSTSRRRYVQLLGTSLAIGLAGCTGGGTDTGGDPQGDDDGGDGGGAIGNPTLQTVFDYENSYVMEFQDSEGSGTWTFHEGDSHLSWTSQGMVSEMYVVDGTSYVVSDGQCYQHTSSGPQEELDLFDPEEPDEASEEYRASGTTTIDGEEVYIFEVGEGNYYVSVATGYPVRFEDGDGEGLVDFHSWGETDPISPPDVECTEY